VAGGNLSRTAGISGRSQAGEQGADWWREGELNWIEVNVLGEGDRGSVVDGTGAPSHVLLPGVASGFSASASFFFSSECPTDLCAAAGGVDVDDPALAPRGSEPTEDIPHVLGEDGGRQAEGGVVVDLHSLLVALDLQDVSDGHEELLLHDVHVVVALHESWPDVEPILKLSRESRLLDTTPAIENFPALLLDFCDAFLVFSDGSGVMQGSEESAWHQRVAGLDLGVGVDQGAHKLVVNLFVNQESAESGAALASSS
jgi:hypothetical protein